MATELPKHPAAQPVTVRSVIELAQGILIEQRTVLDALFSVLEAVRADLDDGHAEAAQARVLAVLEAAPEFRAKSAARTLIEKCRGHA